VYFLSAPPLFAATLVASADKDELRCLFYSLVLKRSSAFGNTVTLLADYYPKQPRKAISSAGFPLVSVQQRSTFHRQLLLNENYLETSTPTLKLFAKLLLRFRILKIGDGNLTSITFFYPKINIDENSILFCRAKTFLKLHF
jgi:hypothetical protein